MEGCPLNAIAYASVLAQMDGYSAGGKDYLLLAQVQTELFENLEKAKRIANEAFASYSRFAAKSRLFLSAQA